MFGPSVRVLRLTAFTPNLLRRLLTSAYASQHLPVSVARGTHADLPGYCAPTFTLMPVGFTPQPSVQVLGFDDFGHLTRLRRLVSASCSSGQRFAFGFLQIRSRPRHPCRSANSSPCRVSRGLSPPSECALPGAPKRKPTKWWAESISRGDMEETEISINPYSCNASVCIAAATFISPAALPSPP